MPRSHANDCIPHFAELTPTAANRSLSPFCFYYFEELAQKGERLHRRKAAMTQLRASMGKVILDYPGDLDLLAAAGRVSLAHGQLELMLCMTIKTLTGLSVRDALDATSNRKTWQLRIDIGKLFRQKTKDVALQYRMRSLLGRCEQLSERRNKLLHNTWAKAQMVQL